MLALVTLVSWQVAALGALVALLLVVLWLHARRWSVKRLVMVRVHYKDGTRKDFITFPWRLEKFFKVLEKSPRRLIWNSCVWSDSVALNIDSCVTRIELCLFNPYSWQSTESLPSNFRREKVLWDSGHALLVNVLRDFGLDDNQPMDVRVLSVFSNQRLDALAMRLTLSNHCHTSSLADNQVAYLERLHDCLIQAIEKKWTRENRYERFSGKLPGTDELVMELIATDGGKEKVIAAINRDWKPEPAPPVPPEPSIQTRTGGHC